MRSLFRHGDDCGRPCVDRFAVVAKAQQCLLRIRGHQRAVLGEHVASAKAAAVRQYWTVLPQQKPAVGAERPEKPHRDVVGTGSLAVLDVQIKATEQIGP